MNPDLWQGSPDRRLPGERHSVHDLSVTGEIAHPDTPETPDDPYDPRDESYELEPVIWGTRGRASRSEWWAIVLGCIAMLWIAKLVGTAFDPASNGRATADTSVGEHISTYGFIALLLVGGWLFIAVTTRRLHDLDRPSGYLRRWNALWVYLEVMFLAGTPGPNRYGPGRGSSHS